MKPIDMEQEIDEAQRLFFMHIGKTGGTTLVTLLDQKFHQDQICPYYTVREAEHASTADFNRYRFYRGHFPIDFIKKKLDAPPLSITLLRDPVDRFVSQFFYMQQLPRPFYGQMKRGRVTKEDIQQFQSMTLDQFMTETDGHLLSFFENSQTHRLAATYRLNRRLKPLYVGRKKRPTPDLMQAQARIDRFVFVGLTEQLHRSVQLLSYIFGWYPVRSTPQRNVTKNRLTIDRLEPGILGRIKACNELDWQLYQKAQARFQAQYETMVEALFSRYAVGAEVNTRKRPSEQLIDQLLFRHYEKRFCARSQTKKSFYFDQRGGISGEGWHLLEAQAGTGIPYRWTGPETQSVVDFPIKLTEPAQIRFEVVAAVSEKILESLCLSVNDIDITITKTNEGGVGRFVYKGHLPQSVVDRADDMLRLTFNVVKTKSAVNDCGKTPDLRRLGVAVSWIKVGN